MNSPAKQAALVLMLVFGGMLGLGGCNGTVTLIDALPAPPVEAAAETAPGDALTEQSPGETTMTSDASDGGVVIDAPEEANPTDGGDQ
jgi:hypothetical protein